MNTTEQIQQAVVELLTPIERTLGACAENRVLASAACDQLRQAIHSLEDAADDDWCLCSRTLANLLEIVGCFADGPDSLEEESAEEIIEFVQSTLPSLRQSLAGEAAAGDVAMRELVEEARARWGEYLTLVEGDGFLAGRALDTELSVDGESDVEETGQRDSSSEQVELILSAVKELSAGARTAGSQSFPVESTGSAAAASTSSDSFFKRRSHTALPAPPAAPQAIPLSEILREAYLEDAEQCLSSMERAVMAFENDSRAQAPIDQLCRDLHTLKGASASIGLSELATYLHEIEEWLPASNANERAGRLQPILDCVDFVRLQIAALKPPGLSSGPGKPNEPVAAHRPLTDVTSGAERSTEPGEETIRVRSSQLDRMMNLLVELVIWRRRRDRRVAELGESGDELSRCVRRLESLAKGYSLSRTSYDSAMPRGSLAADETTRESSKSLGEITSDLREIAGSLRDCRQSMTEENRAVSQFIQQFRQQLAQASRVPLSGLFQRLQRVVREAARLESKQVRLEYVGQNTGLERSLQERLYEPLLHLVRNAVCHGIEPADKRNRTGKPPVGTITLEASGNSQMLVLDVRDDGGGLDFDAIRRRGIERGLLRPDEPVSPNELSRLIFHPGFSTRAQANEVAGRGVGMDVVLTALNRCHCQIEVHSEAGIGTTFRLSIPLPSVIEHSLVFRCGGQLFGLPMQFVMSTSLGSVPSGLEAKALPGSCVELQQVLRLDRPAPQSESRSLCLGSNLQSRSASPNDKSG
ncbi:MAG: chemotaxis protein CheA, partial [Planctomycetaceae bacterium]